MATYSIILAWEIPWTEQPGGVLCGVAKSWTQLSTHARTEPVFKAHSPAYPGGLFHVT